MERFFETTIRRTGRPAKAEPFRDLVEHLLSRDRCAQTRELLERARAAGYNGGKSAFYALVASARAAAREQPIPGVACRHDWGTAEVSCPMGRRRRVSIVVSCLPFSGWLEACVVSDLGPPAILGALEDHFAALGGVPMVAVFEAPAPDGRYHAVFAHVASRLGVGIQLGTERGQLRLLTRLKEAVLRGASFDDMASVSCALDAWRRAQNASIDAARWADERRRLRPVATGVSGRWSDPGSAVSGIADRR